MRRIVLVRFALQFAPEFVGAKQQRHIRRIFEVRFADHPTLPARRTEVVPAAKLLQTNDRLPAARARGQDRAAHPAQARYRHVVVHPAPFTMRWRFAV